MVSVRHLSQIVDRAWFEEDENTLLQSLQLILQSSDMSEEECSACLPPVVQLMASPSLPVKKAAYACFTRLATSHTSFGQFNSPISSNPTSSAQSSPLPVNTEPSSSHRGLLALNTLWTDSQHASPFVRAAVMAALSRVGDCEPYVDLATSAVQRALRDPSAFVRRYAVMAASRLPSVQHVLLGCETAERLLSDADPVVVTNVLRALNSRNEIEERHIVDFTGENGSESDSGSSSEEDKEGRNGGEISSEEGMLVCDKGVLKGLISNALSLDEFGQCELVERLVKEDWTGDDLFPVMNCLDPLLQSESIAVVTATLTFFLSVTSKLPERVQSDVVSQIMTSTCRFFQLPDDNDESTRLSLLTWIDQMLPEGYIRLYGSLAKIQYLMCRPVDSSALRLAKVRLWSRVVTPESARPLADHLEELVRAEPADEAMTYELFASAAEMSRSEPASRERLASVMEKLARSTYVPLLRRVFPYVTSHSGGLSEEAMIEALTVLAPEWASLKESELCHFLAVTRKHGHSVNACAGVLEDLVAFTVACENVTDNESRTEYRYGGGMDNSVCTSLSQRVLSVSTRCGVVSACVACFLEQPAVFEHALSALVEGCDKVENSVVREHIKFYSLLLSQGVDVCRQVVLSK